MKRKTLTPQKNLLMNEIARKVGSMAGSIVHAGSALATTAATIAESGRGAKKPKGTRSSAWKLVARKKEKLTKPSAKTKKTRKRSSQSVR